MLFAIGALGGVLIGNNQQSTAGRARFRQWAFPGSEITFRIICTAVERAAFARFALHEFTAIIRAFDPNLLQPGFRIAAFGEIAAADKLAIASPTDDQIVSALRTGSTDWLRPHIQLGNLFFCFLYAFGKGIVKAAHNFNPWQFTGSHPIQIFFHPCGKANVDHIRKMIRQEIIDHNPGFCRIQPFRITLNVTALLQGAQNGGIGGRAANPILFQRPHQ